MYENHLARRAIGLFTRTLALGITAPIFLAAPAIVQAQSTAFTYQGQLKQSGSPINGNVNLTFRLFDALAAGAQQGPTLTFDGLGGNPPPVAATNGLFTAHLDFGVASYTANQARWLEITVDGQLLTPRQPLTPVPFALNTRGINVDAGGRVGIGTATPTARLEVSGTPGVDGIKFPDGTLQTSATIGVSGPWSSNLPNIFNNNTGSVGIGTGIPNAKLHLSGGPTWTSNGWNKTLALNSAEAIELGYGAGATRFGLGSTSNGLYLFRTSTEAASDSAHYFLSADSAGRIAVGDLAGAVTAKLNIFASGDGTELLSFNTERPWVFKQAYTLSGTALRLQSTVGQKNFEITALGGTNVATFWANDADPSVGIGTTIPTARLHVAGTMKIDGQNTLEFGAGIPKESSAGKIGYQTFGSNDSLDIVGAGTTTSNRKINFWNEGGAAFKGNISVNGTTSTKLLQITGADLAEKFPTSGGKVAPGTVMEIDPNCPGKLRMARGAYNQRVAGVVSGANDFPAGAILGQLPGCEDAPPIALSGRVWTYCDASLVPIAPGDLLTTSATPGHAMKALDRERSHGSIIGKAMSGLARGERGLVLVLVNLQ